MDGKADLAAVFRRRAEGLQRFAEWNARAATRLGPEAALEGVAFLYELLPPASRSRLLDASGVRALHASLAVLGSRGA